ncbi:ABC transporter ATP-binding protein [uncultured Microscilla sp.]|uniref:ABC transporter ATP-binding protein n=1 Tax=uncultured Microscilla sp. TaxID=432653 RepID=UPI0026133747|nr:ABC transporter ATP-binding protein [uncultured Microscilla sp.]
MKTFFRILSFAQPLSKYAIPYFIYSIFATIFGVLNFTLLIPLLKVLFGKAEVTEVPKEPVFELSKAFQYLLDYFNYFFKKLVLTEGAYSALIFVCIIFLASIFLSNIFLYLSIRVKEYMRARVIENVRATFFEKVTSLHLGYFSDQKKGDLMSRITSDANYLEWAVIHSLELLFKHPIQLVSFFIVLFYISVPLTLFTLVFLPVSATIIAFLNNKLKKQSYSLQESQAVIMSILDETLGGLRVIKGFNAIGYIRNKFDKENKHYGDVVRAMARTREMASPISEATGALVVVGILLYGGSLILREQPLLQPTEFITYIILFSQVMRPAKGLTVASSGVQVGLAAGNRIFNILDEAVKINDKENALELEEFKSEIEFKDVHFRYEEDWVLKGINFKLEKGKTVALVGKTGSGKSTIADLIPRFYDIQKGGIYIDGENLQDYRLGSVLQHIGIVSQEAVLFNDTIFNNIAFSVEDATHAEVERAAKIANAHDFIIEKPQGYQTLVGDRGDKLSGGQRQRITIARAVLKNPSILLLDEATAAMDPKTEQLVQDAINNLMQNRTSLVIAHRLSTIQNADEILVVREGHIVERGTHAELLLQENGEYADLHASGIR